MSSATTFFLPSMWSAFMPKPAVRRISAKPQIRCCPDAEAVVSVLHHLMVALLSHRIEAMVKQRWSRRIIVLASVGNWRKNSMTAAICTMTITNSTPLM